MKKIVMLILISFTAVLLYGCNEQTSTITMMSYEIEEFTVNDYSDAAMAIIEETVTNTGLTLELYYYGEDEGTTGSWYALFKYEEDNWNELPYIVDEYVGWNLIAYIVEKNQPREMSIDWEWLYGELSSGKYLIIKEFSNYRGPGDYDDYYLACEFTIS